MQSRISVALNETRLNPERQNMRLALAGLREGYRYIYVELAGLRRHALKPACAPAPTTKGTIFTLVTARTLFQRSPLLAQSTTVIMSGEDIILRWKFPPSEDGRDMRTFNVHLELGGKLEPLHLYKASLLYS